MFSHYRSEHLSKSNPLQQCLERPDSRLLAQGLSQLNTRLQDSSIILRMLPLRFIVSQGPIESLGGLGIFIVVIAQPCRQGKGSLQWRKTGLQICLRSRLVLGSRLDVDDGIARYVANCEASLASGLSPLNRTDYAALFNSNSTGLQ